ncbi:MAG: hypothetical protein JJT76_06485 [Clostridiaceae bacterium]|nr:hypothetical protein [Clostridiaceae bacterium]
MEVVNNEIVENTHQKFIFEKAKDFSYGSYVKILTEATIENNVLCIVEKKKWFGFFKGKHRQHTIPIDDVECISVESTWDFWDCVFAALFGIVALGNFLLFLITALFLFSAYGKKIEIKTKHNTKTYIQISDSSKDIETFTEAVNLAKVHKVK